MPNGHSPDHSHLDIASLPFSPICQEDGELPDGAILIVRSHLDGDRTRVTTRVTDGTDWVVIRGLIEVAHDEIVSQTLALPTTTGDEEYGDDH